MHVMQIYLSICLLLFKGFYVCVNQYLYVNYKSDHVSSKDLDQTVNIDNIYNLFKTFFLVKVLVTLTEISQVSLKYIFICVSKMN